MLLIEKRITLDLRAVEADSTLLLRGTGFEVQSSAEN